MMYSRVFSLYLFFVFLFPLLPKLMGDSQIHINFITLVSSLIFVFLFRNKIYNKSILVLSVYFFVLQMLLFGSLYIGLKHEDLALSSIFSALRPTLLFLLYLSIVEGCRRYEIFSSSEFKYFIILSFVYVILEVLFLEYSSDLIFALYKREYRPELFFAGTTFFGTTYYSGYAFLCFFFLSFVKMYNDRRFVDHVVFFMAFLLVLMSLSKTMIVSLLISTHVFLFYHVKSYFFRLIMVFIPPLFVISIFFFKSDISFLLKESGIPALRSINTLLYDYSNSGTLLTRANQIVDSFNTSQGYSAFWGVGLGQNVSIESLPAVFMYRYGILGVLFFYLCNFALFIYATVKTFKEGRDFFALNLSLLMWVLTLPITQLSGAMVEQSKMAVVSALMLGYLLRNNKSGVENA